MPMPLILFVATLFFGCGLVLPIAEFERLFVLTERPSLIGIVAGLWSDGDWLLAAVVALFSVVFPATKLAVLHSAAYAPHRAELVTRVGFLSKWSMMDVLVVALAVFAAKTSGLASAAALPGLWFYAVAALLSAIAAALIKKRAVAD